MNGANGYYYGAPPPPPQPPQQAQPPRQAFGPPPQSAYGTPVQPTQQSAAYGAYGAPPPQSPPRSQYGSVPPPAYGYGYAQPPSSFGPAGPVYPQQGITNINAVPPKNPGLAVALELLGGFFLQTFGIGHLYSGNVGMGLGLMFGYWALTAVNIVLCFLFIGFITWPLTWLAFMILSAITASSAANKANAKAGGLAY